MAAANDDMKQEARVLAFAQKAATQVHALAITAGIESPADLLCVFGTMHAMTTFWAVNEAGAYESREAALEQQEKLLRAMFDSFKLKPRVFDA